MIQSLNHALASNEQIAAGVSVREIPDVRTVNNQLDSNRTDLAQILEVSTRTLKRESKATKIRVAQQECCCGLD